MLLFLALTLALALLEIFAVYRESRQLEYFAKPAVILVLLAWLILSAGLSGAPVWFAAGLVFSLIGDVLMIQRERFFLHALVAFLLAVLSYLVGFNLLPAPLSIWSLFMAVVIGLSAARMLRRVILGVHAKGQSRLALPVMLYGATLSLMLLSALLTLSNPAWNAWASVLVALGAALFFLSENLQAWDRFVSPIQRGRFKNIIPYELGQILIIAGVILQFS